MIIAAASMNTWVLGALIVLYVGIIGYLGYRGFRKTHSSGDYLLAGRSTNPFVMAMPGPDGGPVVLMDMAMSQYSYGKGTAGGKYGAGEYIPGHGVGSPQMDKAVIHTIQVDGSRQEAEELVFLSFYEELERLDVGLVHHIFHLKGLSVSFSFESINFRCKGEATLCIPENYF